jgi:single-strand DNA-binding protein
MPNLAHITLIGHLGRDPDIKTVGQSQVVEFSVAYSQKSKDAEITTWFRCSYWGERAVKVAQYLSKGKAVCVVGGLSEREYEAKDGTKKKSLEVRVDNLTLLGGRDDAGAGGAPAAHRPAAPAAGADARPSQPPADDDSSPF